MAFMQNNNFGNNNFGNSNGNGNGEKKSFSVGRIWAADGQIDVGIYKSQSATWVSVSGKKAIGTNPSSGSLAIEQTQPQQLPSVLLSIETARAFLDGAIVEDSKIPTLNYTIQAGGQQHSVISVQGSPSDVKVTFKSDRGERVISLTAIQVGDRSSYAGWKNFIDFVKIAYKKAMQHKLSPEEFAGEINGGSSEDSDEAPF